MRWTDRWLRRVDVRLGLVLAVIFAPLVTLVLLALYAFSANEVLELANAEVVERVDQLQALLEESDAPLRAAKLSLLAEQLARDGGGFRVLGPDGQVTLQAGRALKEISPARSPDRLLAAVRLSRGEGLRAQRRLPSGQLLEVAIGSEGFVRERDAIQRGFWISLALGVGLVIAGAVPATRSALAPLRRATLAAREVDAERLATRLPVRGTRDDVDRHAQAVNELLDRLEAGFERIRRFSQDVAHELRTPVNRILNVAEIALLESDVGARARGELESIRNAAGHLARTIDGLLLLARSEEGHLRLEARPVDVAALCRTLEEMYGPACEERGLRLALDAPAPANVIGEPALLLRALGNLIDNAIAYSPPGGTIRLRALREDAGGGAWVAIEVEDAGPGVAPADRERIFQRFVRIEPAPRERPASAAPSRREGSGLGLAIARGLLRAHGGDLELRDSGGGARFAARLPRAAEAAGLAPDQPGVSPGALRG